VQKNVKFNFLDFVKKNSQKFVRLLFASIMDTESKISLKIAVIESCKHNSKKSNEYAHKNFKNRGVHKARIQKIKIKKNGINQNTVIESVRELSRKGL